MPSSRRLVVVLVLLAALPLMAAPPGDVSPSDAPQHLVTLTLTVGQADPVTFGVPAGAMATFESAELGHRLGIVAHVVDAAAGDVDVELVDLAAPRPGKGAQPAAALPTERVTGKVGFQGAATVGTVPVDVAVVSVAPAPAAMQRACTGDKTALGPGGIEQVAAGVKDPIMPQGCCVSCDGIRVCACQVDRGCGTCCGCDLC